MRVDWLHHPCRLGGSRALQSEGQNQKWPTSGQIGYITTAILVVPNASERLTKSEMAHKCAEGLHHRGYLGGLQRFRAGDVNRSGPQLRGLAS